MLRRWDIIQPVRGYTASGVKFDSSKNAVPFHSIDLVCTSLQCVDNGQYSFSFWAKDITATDRPKPILWEHDPNGGSNPTVQINSTALNQGVQLSILFNSLTTGYSEFPFVIGDGNWHHYLGSFNTALGAGQKTGVLYVDDQIVGPDVFTDNGQGADNNVCDFKPLYFGGLGNSQAYNFSVADVWIGAGVQLLTEINGVFFPTIPVANRRIFTTIIGPQAGVVLGDGSKGVLVPNDPAVFPCAPVLFTGNASIFGSNFGVAQPKCSLNFWGGSFSLNFGTLADVVGPGGITI